MRNNWENPPRPSTNTRSDPKFDSSFGQKVLDGIFKKKKLPSKKTVKKERNPSDLLSWQPTTGNNRVDVRKFISWNRSRQNQTFCSTRSRPLVFGPRAYRRIFRATFFWKNRREASQKKGYFTFIAGEAQQKKRVERKNETFLNRTTKGVQQKRRF